MDNIVIIAKLNLNNYNTDSFRDPEQQAVHKMEPGVLAKAFPPGRDKLCCIFTL